MTSFRPKKIFCNIVLWSAILLFCLLYTCSFYRVENDANARYTDGGAELQLDTARNLLVAAVASGHIAPPVAGNNSDERQKKYFVYGAKCKVAYVEPFTEELLKIFDPEEYESCTNESDLVSSYFDANLQQYFLHYDTAVGQELMRNAQAAGEDFHCCYQKVQRSGTGAEADRRFTLSKCTRFGQNFMVPPDISAMIVECYDALNRSQIIQQDGFTFVQRRKPVKVRTKQRARARRKPSVLMIGIDSISRMNLRRTMPNTFEFLSREHWYEMQGYNKIGDNTFPNLMAVLAGYNVSTATRICQPTEVGGLDVCPLIWKYFQSIGYMTAFAEDESSMSTFNYLKPGFQYAPVDHYLRPFLLAATDKLPEHKRWGLHYCLGRRHSAQYIYDFCTQFANRYHDQPIFGLFWANSFSHNSYESPAAMDNKTREFLEGLQKTDVLDTAIVILFSDHGMRWGEIVTKVKEGFFEERLPMLFISLPAWFSRQYPENANALRLNQNRLTSPYDLYNTLVHIIDIAEPTLQLNLPVAVDCPRCQTLFRAVPEDRDCVDAGIPEHWCTCIPYEVVRPTELIQTLTGLIIADINHYIEAKNLSSLCRTIVLDRIEMAERRTEPSASAENIYRIEFVTQPNEGDFQATIMFNSNPHAFILDVEAISRLNSYERDSKCINDKQAKKYCFCH